MEGLDFFVEHLSWKRLPKELLEPLGGAVAAKALRAERGYGVVKKVEPAASSEGGESISEGQSASESATDTAQVKSEANVKTESGQNESKEEILQVSAQYNLGQRYFPSDRFEGFGASNVDTIEKSRKKLRAEAFGGEANLENALYNKKIALMKDLPVILPNKLFGKNKQQHMPLPNVTWNLLDGK